MSAFTASFDDLYSCQTESLGAAILATVEGYAVDKPAILSSITTNDILLQGGDGQTGGFSLQMKVGDFTGGEPEKQTRVSCNGDAEGLVLEVLDCDRANGIFTITLGDFATN